MQNYSVAEILQSENFLQEIVVRGWVRTFRSNRFIALNDGSTLKNVQCVIDFENTPEDLLRRITTGAALEIKGTLAESKGSGQKVEIQVSEIEILGDLKPLPDFKLPPMGGSAVQNNPAVQERIEARTLLRPQADSALCTGCGTCVEQCPVSALAMNENLPEVDADTCITCFCCQEICPEKAIALV